MAERAGVPRPFAAARPLARRKSAPGASPEQAQSKPCRSRYWLLDERSRANLSDPRRSETELKQAYSGGDRRDVHISGRHPGFPIRTEQVDASHEKPLAVLPTAAFAGAEGLDGWRTARRYCALDYAAHSPASRHEASRPDADATGLYAHHRSPRHGTRTSRDRRRAIAYARHFAGPQSLGIRAAARLENL